MLPVGLSGVTGSSGEARWENENKDSDKVRLRSFIQWPVVILTVLIKRIKTEKYNMIQLFSFRTGMP